MEILKNRILVIQTAFPGDAVLTLPMIQKLKELNPDSEIDVLCIPSTKEIFDASPSVNEVIVIDKKGTDRSFFRFIRFVLSVRKRKYDKIYSPHRSFRTGLILLFSGASEKYGFSNSSLPLVLNNIIRYNPDVHEVKRNLSLIGYDQNGNDWQTLPVIETTQEDKNKISNYLTSLPGLKFAAVAPGSVWNTKKYPAEYYVKIIQSLIQRNYLVLLIGGKSDSEYCSQIESDFKENVISTAGRFSLIESIELLKHCDILISNDSAPTHLGMCADIPVLTIYCSTIPGFGFYPYNTKSAYLSFDDLSCKPCGIHGHDKCPIGTFECGYKLLPKTIISKMDEMLNEEN